MRPGSRPLTAFTKSSPLLSKVRPLSVNVSDVGKSTSQLQHHTTLTIRTHHHTFCEGTGRTSRTCVRHPDFIGGWRIFSRNAARKADGCPGSILRQYPRFCVNPSPPPESPAPPHSLRRTFSNLSQPRPG